MTEVPGTAGGFGGAQQPEAAGAPPDQTSASGNGDDSARVPL
jgi:hypothetical protein